MTTCHLDELDVEKTDKVSCVRCPTIKIARITGGGRKAPEFWLTSKSFVGVVCRSGLEREDGAAVTLRQSVRPCATFDLWTTP